MPGFLLNGRKAFLVLLAYVSAGIGCLAATRARELALELDIAIGRGGVAKMAFDFGDGVWADSASAAQVAPGDEIKTVRLALPERAGRGLRFEPTSGREEVFIAGMRVVDERGAVLLRIDPQSLRPGRNIGVIAMEGNGVRLQPSGENPTLRFDIGPLQKKLHEVSGRRTVGRGSVVGLALGLTALLGTAVVVAWRAFGGGAMGRSATGAGAAIFCVVFGARLIALNRCGRPVPFWDEWEGDAWYILVPFTGGFLDWGALVMPQWEHRILLTRVIGLCGTLLNGEWDVRVAMTASAALYAAAIAILGTALVATGRTIAIGAALALAACAALPFDVHNLFWGGQTQMYALILMAVCAIALASAPRVTWVVQAAALAGGAVSLFTMGAGPVGPGCAVGICLVRSGFEWDQRRRLLALAAVFFAVVLTGVGLHTTSRGHVPLYATSVAQFWRTFVGVLSWPLAPGAFCALALWAPWAINGIAILRRREASPLEWIGVGLGAWGMINAVALGYARPYEGPPFDSRFFTPISIGALGAVCSSVALALRAPSARLASLPGLAGLAAVAGLATVGVRGIELARQTGAARAEMDHGIRMYLLTGDAAPLLQKLPHYDVEWILEKLDSPLLQQIFPTPWRRILATREGRSTAGIEAGPVTLTVRTLMKLGAVILALGVVGCGWVVWRQRRKCDAANVRI